MGPSRDLAVGADRFRQVLGSIPQPVSVVTTADERGPHGTTVGAFSSLSLEPPLVLVALDRGSELLSLLERGGDFAVNVLARDQPGLARNFARKGRDKFEGVEWSEEHGLPVLPGAHSHIACELLELVPGGDHVIAIGRVLAAASRETEPLVYRERAFWTLAEAPEPEQE